MSGEPKGVIAIITSPNGAVCVSETDFDLTAPAGFSLPEAQAYRAKRAAIWKFFREWCHQDIAKAMHAHQMDEVFRRMDGYRVSTVEVGHVE